MDQQKLKTACQAVSAMIESGEFTAAATAHIVPVLRAAESLLAGVPCKVIHAAHGMWGTAAAAVPFDLGQGQECDAVIVRLPTDR